MVAKKHKSCKFIYRVLAPLAAILTIVLTGLSLTASTAYALLPASGGSTSSSSSSTSSSTTSGTTPVTCPSGETDVAGACEQSLKTGDTNTAQYHCGSGSDVVDTSIDFGCTGKGSALTDASFAIIRFLSIGVGLVIVASMIFAGIQYTTSHDDPAAVGKAKERVMNNIIALLVYIFAYAILNYLIPKGFFG